MTSTFQTDNDLVKEYYKKDNFLIEYSDNVNNICCIYFSDNAIYYPNEESEFKKQIVEKNYFSWYKRRVTDAYKHIFVRDIQKQWYIEGINARTNSTESLLNFLKKETDGYNITTVGSSAGGYAAVLFGKLLNAQKIITINGQFELFTLLERSTIEKDPLLFRYANSERSSFFDLNNYLTINKSPVLYFYSTESDWDVSQNKHISNVKEAGNIYAIPVKSDVHGIPFPIATLESIFNSSSETLLKIDNRNPLTEFALNKFFLGKRKAVNIEIKKLINSAKSRVYRLAHKGL